MASVANGILTFAPGEASVSGGVLTITPAAAAVLQATGVLDIGPGVQAPATPSLSMTLSGRTITAICGDTARATSYNVRYRVGTSGSWFELGAQSGRSFSIQGSFDTTYQFEAQASNSGGSSDWGSRQTVTVGGVTPTRSITLSSIRDARNLNTIRVTFSASGATGWQHRWNTTSATGPTWVLAAGSNQRTQTVARQVASATLWVQGRWLINGVWTGWSASEQITVTR